MPCPQSNSLSLTCTLPSEPRDSLVLTARMSQPYQQPHPVPSLALLGPACFSKHTISSSLSAPPSFCALPAVDSISSLSWSPLANYLIVTSWDNHVRCYNVQPGAMTTPAQSSYMAGVTHQQPVLCSAWLPDGQKVVSAGGLSSPPACLIFGVGVHAVLVESKAPRRLTT